MVLAGASMCVEAWMERMVWLRGQFMVVSPLAGGQAGRGGGVGAQGAMVGDLETRGWD